MKWPVDMLTGIQNRNRMNAMVDDVRSGRMTLQTPYAVVFADLNGLKHINDEDGHSEGDRILKKAAEVLSGAFPDSEVYRAGGDEFMVIAEGLDEETAEAKRKQIRERAAAVDGLVFAIGIHIVRCGEDIVAAMRAADREMYAEKRDYYTRHPDKRSR